uniref:Uncharacterized protein n=1 Tax=Panagrolaimus sp. JU765 TaxID=591449 RepID=A0AC34Q7D7_9BILA
AAVYDQANALKILLGLGADPYVPDNEGMTPTDHASLLANKECLVELIKNGGKVYESNKAGKSVTQKSC